MPNERRVLTVAAVRGGGSRRRQQCRAAPLGRSSCGAVARPIPGRPESRPCANARDLPEGPAASPHGRFSRSGLGSCPAPFLGLLRSDAGGASVDLAARGPRPLVRPREGGGRRRASFPCTAPALSLLLLPGCADPGGSGARPRFAHRRVLGSGRRSCDPAASRRAGLNRDLRTSYTPTGCQTVLSSRKGAISQGL